MRKSQIGSEQILRGQVTPNVIVAGAAKAGTTSLYQYCRQHPEIFVPEHKEPGYFANDYGIKRWDEYLALFQGATTEKAVVEFSSLYNYCEESPSWIRSALGKPKIIFLLRNPAERAFSLYAWMVREGYEAIPTFEEALRSEPERLRDPVFQRTAPHAYRTYGYFTTGLYFEQLTRWMEIFGREQVGVFLFDDLVRDPGAFCTKVFRFLGVDDTFQPRLAVHNKGRLPKSIPWHCWLRAETRRKRWFGLRSFRRGAATSLMNWNLALGCEPWVDLSTMDVLTFRYREDIERTSALIGRNLSSWMETKAGSSKSLAPI